MTAGSLLGAGAVLLTMACLPATAIAAPTPNISITSVGPDANGDPYDLTVIADDGNGLPIQTMTAHVYDAGGTDVADVPMTAVSTSNPAAQTWAASTPIPEADLPAGTYTVTVDAADADESDSALPTPGFSFSPLATTSLSVSNTPPYVTQGSQVVTFSGTLTAAGETGGPAFAIPGAPVLLSISGSTPTLVTTTNGSGQFSYPLSGVAETATYAFTVAATATYPAAAASVTVNADAAQTSMTAIQTSQSSVSLSNESVTFTGTVQVTPPDATTPVGIGSDIPIYLSVNGGASSVVTTTDDTNGDFTYTAPGITQASEFVFSVAATSLYTGYTAPEVSIGTEIASTAMINMAASPAFITYGSQSVTFTGTVEATPGGGPAVGIGSGVPVYLTAPGGSATEVTTTDDANGDFTYTDSGLTAGGDYTFSVGAGSLYGAASYPVQVSLDPGATAIAVTANPPDVHLGSSTVVFSGTVQVTPQGSSTAAGVPVGTPVLLSIGGSTPAAVTTTDDANGDFSYTATGVTQPADYEFSVQAGTFYTAQSQTVAIGLDQLNSTLAVTASSASVTEGAQSVTFSGTLTGVIGTGAAQDIPNAPVDVTITNSKGTTDLGEVTTTNGSGGFSYTMSGISAADTFQFSVASTSTYTQANESVSVGVVQAQTRITTASTSPAKLSYGQSASLTGTVQYLNGSTWTALPDASVQLAEGDATLQTVASGIDGTFDTTLPTTDGVSWTATVEAGILTQQSRTAGSLDVAVGVKLTKFAAKLAVDNKVSTSGCAVASDPIGSGPQPSIDIEYSATAHGPWKLLGSEQLVDTGRRVKSCRSAVDSYFTGAIQAKSDNAYYRAYYPATSGLSTSGLAGYSFNAATSDVIHSAMDPTRIVSCSLSPSTVANKQEFKFRCRLEVRISNRWKPWSGQKVVFKYDYQQDPTVWEYLETARTNSSGWVAGDGAGGTGDFVFFVYGFYLGNSDHLASQSKGMRVTNRNGKSALSLTASTQSQLPESAVLPELYPQQLSLTPLLAG